jgi:UvrD-like helicase C-terminal domain/UvrD/REP helicase N-terminal domain
VGLSDVRAALRSDAALVVVEAPAGCGKTFEAVACAIDLATSLGEHQEVLLLAHTNAAVAEFRRRARREGARVHATTLDALALGLVAPYAHPLGLPSPLTPGTSAGDVPFDQLAPKALELLRRAPSLAAALRAHYPVILLDEHQDARRDQHDLAVELGRSGRVRIFGDPMQAIYDFGGEALMPWDSITDEPGLRTALEDPQRWPHAPDLGAWILAAREALRTGGYLPLDSAPDCVRVVHVSDLDDVPNVNSDRVTPAIIPALGGSLRALNGSTVVLARNNAHVRGLSSAVRGSLVVHEGVDFSAASAALAQAEAAVGDPAAMACVIVDLLHETGRGLTTALRRQLDASLRPDSLDRGNRRVIAPLLDALEPLYDTSDIPTWCRAIGQVLRHPPGWLRIDLSASLQLLARLRPHEDETPRAALDAAVQHRHDAASVPSRCASTIHKAKGQEFDHVVVAHCSASPFPDKADARRLLYVALSRARRSITIIASGRDPSPLLG